jgi:hypothetical protein
MDYLDYFVVWIVFCVLVGALIGKHRGRAGSGVIWGGLLGPVGWLIVALMEDMRPKCTQCGGVIVEGARKCLHCGSLLSTIGVVCPACGQAGEVPESLSGQRIECRVCKKTFTAKTAHLL